MLSSIKSISPTQLQDEIARFLSELTDKECSVSISEIKFDENISTSLSGIERITFVASASLKKPASEEEKTIPF